MVTDIQQQSKVKTKPQESNKNESPNTVGQLVGEVCLAVHTHQAQRLIWGRRQTAQKSPITGLIAFASFGSIMLATRLDKVGEAAILRETSTVFAALIGWLVLKETVGPRRIALMALIALGAVIVEFAG